MRLLLGNLQVTKAKIAVEQKPWKRVMVGGALHDHGYTMEGEELRTTYVTVDKAGHVEITSGAAVLAL